MAVENFVDALPAGSEVGGYVIGGVLGQGGFGITYEASSATGLVERRVAIKEFFPANLAHRQNGSVVLSSRVDKASYEAALRRFEAEAQRLVDIYDHPGIVRGENVVRAHGSVFFVMEFVEGRMLSDIVAERGTLDEATLRAVMEPVFDAVDYLHDLGAMHRDLSPRNIMIRTRRRGRDVFEPVLIDFGALADGLDLVRDSTIAVANPSFAPPEQQEPEAVAQGRYTDIFALAGVLYACVTGRPPVKPMARLSAVAHGTRPDPHIRTASAVADPAAWSPELLDGIDRALALDPAARPASIREFREALGWARAGGKPITGQRLRQTAGPRSEPTTIVDLVPPARRRKVWLGAGAAAAVVLALVGGVAVLRPDLFGGSDAGSTWARDTHLLDAAGWDRAKLMRLAADADTGSVRTAASGRLAQIDRESELLREATETQSRERLQDYLSTCRACLDKGEVERLAARLGAPARPAGAGGTLALASPAEPGMGEAAKAGDAAGAPAAPPVVPPAAPLDASRPVAAYAPPRKAEDATAKAAAAAERLAASPETLSRRYAALAAAGAGIADPRTPPELYHNARMAEARGDAAAARRDYLALAAFDLDAVDAWLRLAALVRVQDGRAAAREVFASFDGRGEAPARRLAAATLAEDSERRAQLEAFVAERPLYGPAWYLLADEYSEARLGARTLAEQRRERDALGRFLQAAPVALREHFLDQSLLDQWQQAARNRYGVVAAALQKTPVEPQTVIQRSNSDWTVHVQLPEAALGFSYRLDPTQDFVEASGGWGLDPRTGRPYPNTNISIVPGREPEAVEVKYRDLRGDEVGPFRLPFDGMGALMAQQKQALELTKGAWVAFRDYNGLLLYTTHLVSYRCTIAQATLSLDGGPAAPIGLPPCDPKDPFANPPGEAGYTKVPAATRAATVRLVYRDGTTSESTIPRR